MRKRKLSFIKELEEAKSITNPWEREQYYSIITRCKLKDIGAKYNAKKYKK